MKVIIDEKKMELTVTLPITPNPQPSRSGKTIVIASTHGNTQTGQTYKGQPVTVGMNAYHPAIPPEANDD